MGRRGRKIERGKIERAREVTEDGVRERERTEVLREREREIGRERDGERENK